MSENEMREALDELNALIGTNLSLVVRKHITGERGPMAEEFYDEYRDEYDLTIDENGISCPEEVWMEAFHVWCGFFRGWYDGQKAMKNENQRSN